ncbi:hypothetical protein Rhal01_02683 [Rubritalea halochordaticola]|uniref:Sulfatase N-terminal domain-containing protein n=1 Tax=Rubritalea halochordaticola TaxID=714537 RepID=A0ABP9V1C9_9BACT
MMNRLVALFSLLLSGLVSAAPVKPNVVVIMTDDQGYGDLSCLGNAHFQTPNLDALHANSVRFTDFHVDPTCSPTRSALMTGRYSRRVGVWHTIVSGNFLREGEVTMADVFTQNGYRTGMFGKWHLGNGVPYRPIDRGFQEVLTLGDGGPGTTADYMFNDRVNDLYNYNGEWEEKPRAGWAPDVFFDAAENFVKTTPDDQPFFLYLPSYLPHGPHTIPDLKLAEPFSETVKKHKAQYFYAGIRRIDERIGQLRKLLEERKLSENTIFIFLTDNGGTAGVKVFNAGMRGKKGSEYDGGHRVPLFVHWPAGKLAAGKEVGEMTMHIDILPTLVDMLDLKTPEKVNLDGRSFATQLRKPEAKLPERSTVIERQRNFNGKDFEASVVLRGKWRLVNGKQLYDISKDPGQKQDLAAGNPDLVKQLRDDYLAYAKDVGRPQEQVETKIVGSEQQPEVMLHSHDCYGRSMEPWNHALVARGARSSGNWVVRVQQPGKYRLEVRRWPREAKTALNAAPDLKKRPVDSYVTGGKPVHGLLQGANGKAVALPVESVSLSIDGAEPELNKPDEGAELAVFEHELTAGRHEIKAMLLGKNGKPLTGAYFIYIRRIP